MHELEKKSVHCSLSIGQEIMGESSKSAPHIELVCILSDSAWGQPTVW